jgi:hypothetical protein
MRFVSRSRQSLAVVATCVAVTFCGGSSPTSPSSSQSGSSSGAATGSTGSTGGTGGAGASTSCRTAIATYRVVTTGPGFTSTVNGNCTFNPTTVESTCTNIYTDSIGGSFTSMTTTKNSSRGEVVDEVSVIPPLTLSSSTTGNILAGGTVPASSSTGTRTFSGRRVLTQSNTSQPAGQVSTTTYTAWDSSDRPTAATTQGAGGGQTSQVTYSYDNVTRTQTITQSGVTCTQTFDPNGNPLVGNCGGATSTMTTLTTQQICR